MIFIFDAVFTPSHQRQSAYMYCNISYNQAAFNVIVPRHFSFLRIRMFSSAIAFILFFNFYFVFFLTCDILTKLRSRRPKVFCKKAILKNFTKSAGNYSSWSLFSIKLQTCCTDEKSGLGTVVLLWVLQHFSKNFFCRTPYDGCFRKITGFNKSLITLNITFDSLHFWFN